jgi:hypothetical protein
MIFQQRTIHFLGLSIGFPLRDFKWHLRKQKLSPISSGESNKMLPKILSQDSNYDEWCEQELLNAYKDAAESDLFLFGDYDYSYVWKDSKSNDVY